MHKVKSGKASRLLEVSVKMIVVTGEIGVKVMIYLCQNILNGRGTPDEWKTIVIVPICIKERVIQ